jgi:hypothetical protein
MNGRTRSRTALFGCAALLVVVAAVLAGGQSTAHGGPPADAVLDWNLHAVQALINAPATATPPGNPPGMGQPPPVSVLHLAMVQGAVYDAVNMIDGGHKPYLEGLPAAPASASKAAAVATAAHDVLVGVNIVPPLTAAIVQRLDDRLAESIVAATAQDGSAAVAAGIAAGEAAAEAMLEARENDRRYSSFSFTVGTGIGEWRPTPPAFVNDPNGWVAVVEPFAMKSQSQFRTPGPRTVGTEAYREEYEEVKSLGGNGTTTPTLRTAAQTAVAQFFTANPVEMFNRTFRGVAASEGLDLVEQARLFAMLNVAGADAAIACWDDKEYWRFWRPITAIRSDDGEPLTVSDPNWTSLIAAPPYPDHPSGYNCQAGAFMHAAKRFFNKDLPFSLTANLASGPVTRTYEHFTDLEDDTIDARVWLGIHFRSADVDGAWIGKRAANWVAAHYFGPGKGK